MAHGQEGLGSGPTLGITGASPETRQARRDKKEKENSYEDSVKEFKETSSVASFATREQAERYLRDAGATDEEIYNTLELYPQKKIARDKEMALSEGEKVIFAKAVKENLPRKWVKQKIYELKQEYLAGDKSKVKTPGSTSGSTSGAGIDVQGLLEGSSESAGGGFWNAAAKSILSKGVGDGGLSDRLGERSGLIKEKGELEAGIHDAEEAAYSEAADIELKTAEAKLALQERRDEADKRVSAALELGMADLRSMKVNPFRVYKNTWAALGAALATALGAYAQGLSGGRIPNTALKILDHAQEMDIKAQVHEYNNAKDKMALADNMYARMMKQFGDEDIALNATKVNLLQFLDHSLKARTASGNQQLKMVAAQLSQNKIQVDMALNKQRASESLFNTKAQLVAGMARLEAQKNLAEGRGAGGLKGKAANALRAVKSARGSLAQLKHILDMRLGKASTLDRIGFGLQGKLAEKAPLASALLTGAGVLSLEDKEKLTEMIPHMSSKIFQMIAVLDPSGRISDEDRRWFQARGLTMDDIIAGPSIYGTKISAWEDVITGIERGILDSRVAEAYGGTVGAKVPDSNWRGYIMQRAKSDPRLAALLEENKKKKE
tara:strand:+ start:14728 stop:16554 length:1827 start_codon:yes stop_codon:yes gene_type:complete